VLLSIFRLPWPGKCTRNISVFLMMAIGVNAVITVV
jgi:hypothetical protein